METFQQTVNDRHIALASDFSAEADTMLVAFGGMARNIGLPPFEFFKLTGDMPVKRLFVRDPHRAWYHLGIPEVGSTVNEVAAHLRSVIDDQGVDRVVVTGNSAGGYAALLFGMLIDADAVIAFAPQTMLDRDELARVDDHRWDKFLDRLEKHGGPDPSWEDLAEALTDASRCEIHYPRRVAADAWHARRMKGTGARLHGYDFGGHGLIRRLRETGDLKAMLERALAGTRP